MVDTMWALAYISDNLDLDILHKAGIMSMAVILLEYTEIKVITVALRIVSNFASDYNNRYDKELLEMGILQKIAGLCKNVNSSVKKEAYFMLSNIAANSQEYFELVISTPDLLQNIVSTICSSMINDDVKTEAMHILTNGSYNLTYGNIFELLMNEGILKCIKIMLHVNSKKKDKIIIEVLSCLKKLIQIGDKLV
jgi:hypothetical protein